VNTSEVEREGGGGVGAWCRCVVQVRGSVASNDDTGQYPSHRRLVSSALVAALVASGTSKKFEQGVCRKGPSWELALLLLAPAGMS
jgi:hypothetical protein